MSVTANHGDPGDSAARSFGRPPGPAAPPAEPDDDLGHAGITFAATLVDQWVRLGVRHAVVSPGSRSTPLALACAEHRDLTTHVHHDERAAAFMAVGIGRATGVPAIVVTTSGTAAAELHAAVVEAFQAHVPMLVATADRPPELQGVGAPQTIDQRRLFGTAVRWFVEPGPPDHRYRNSWRHLATDAFVAALGTAVGRPPGPVHLNLAFREPLLGDLGPLPPDLDLASGDEPVWGLLDEQLGVLVPAMVGARGLILAGARASRSDADAEAILGLAAELGWPVIADHLSGVRVAHPSVVTAADPILRVSEAADRLRPEFVLRIGGMHASRVLNEWLAASRATHIGLDRWGSCPDPDHLLVDTFTADVALACDQLASAVVARERQGVERGESAEWLLGWQEVERIASEAIRSERSGEPAVVAAALAGVPDGGALLVSSSMPVRDLEWYGPVREGVTVHSNRGANGIDGVMSTAVGIAATGTPTVCVIGDVAFLHDTNALLGLAARALPICVVVIDNDGGGIFSFLGQAEALEPDRFEQLFGTPHGADLAGLCRSHGVAVTEIDVDAATAGEMTTLLHTWGAAVAAGPSRSSVAASGPGGEPEVTQVISVRSERRANVSDHRRINEAVAAALGERLRGG